MIIIIAEHQHIKNDYTCSFCEDKNKPVVGRAYKQEMSTYPDKYYLFAYCADCGLKQAEEIVKLVHPKRRDRPQED
jgi:hypothetical protein